MDKKIGEKFIYTDKDERKHQLLAIEDTMIDCTKCFFGNGLKIAHSCKTNVSIVGRCTGPDRIDGKYLNFILLRSQKLRQ
jgi:hypothetical protein